MMKEKSQPSDLLKLTRMMLFVNALLWAVFAVLSFVRASQGDSNWRWVLSVLMLVNAVIMTGLGLLLTSRRRWVFVIATLYIAVNAVLSITDQFGAPDAVILIFNLVTLGLLVAARHRVSRTEA